MEELLEMIPALAVAAVAIIGSIRKAMKNPPKKEDAPDLSFPWAKADSKAAPQSAPKASAAPAAPVKRPAQPMTPMQPTIHPHVAPECETHDAPGSLGVTSLEGKDPCHEQQLAPGKRPRPDFDDPQTEVPGLTFDWTGENMVKAVVLQEVLQRPAQRHR